MSSVDLEQKLKDKAKSKVDEWFSREKTGVQKRDKLSTAGKTAVEIFTEEPVEALKKATNKREKHSEKNEKKRKRIINNENEVLFFSILLPIQ